MEVLSGRGSEVEIELEGYVGEDREEIWIGGCDAGGVEKSCYSADGGGCCCCVGSAGVVLRSAADSDVL